MNRKKPIAFPRYGERVADYRRQLGLSKEQLAEMAGISSSYLRYIEKSQQMAGIEILFNLAKALKVSIEDILVEKEQPQENIEKDELLSYVSRMSPKEIRILKSLVNGVLPVFFLEEARSKNNRHV